MYIVEMLDGSTREIDATGAQTRQNGTVQFYKRSTSAAITIKATFVLKNVVGWAWVQENDGA